MTKRIIDELHLSHIAAVDNPCQEGAKAKLTKRAPDLIAICKALDDEGARSFAEILEEDQARRARWEADEQLWPLFDALRCSLTSVAADQTLNDGQKMIGVQQNISQFMTALQDQWPDVMEEVAEATAKRDGATKLADMIKAAIIGKGEMKMDEIETLKARVAELEKSETQLTADLAAANKRADTAEATVTKMTGDKEKMDGEMDDMKKRLADAVAKSDETVKIAGTDQIVKRSEVGDASFSIIKAQEARVVKAECEKRAGTDFNHLPGTVAEKGELLAKTADLPDDVKKTFDSIMTAAEKMAAGAFASLGHSDGQRFNPGADVAKAKDDFMAKVEEIRIADKCTKAQAIEKATRQYPALQKAYQGEAVAAN